MTFLGFRVLLLEARDRIGGRTYTAKVDGHMYEMGGRWVHWTQPHVYREMSRYGLTDLEKSVNSEIGCQCFSTLIDGKLKEMSHEEEVCPKAARMKIFLPTDCSQDAKATKAFNLFCNIDGANGRTILPLPHDPHFNFLIRHFESLSVADRLTQIGSSLTNDELAILQAFICAASGNDMEHTGFFDILRWWALCDYNLQGFRNSTETWKIRTGQSDFARHFFDEAIATGNLGYSFCTKVLSVEDRGNNVTVRGHQAQTWVANRVICTVPLNVLHETSFEPPLPKEKIVASTQGHIGQGAKYHFEFGGKDLRSWSAIVWPPSRIVACVGDGLTPKNNTHVVAFGPSVPFAKREEDAQSFIADIRKLHDIRVKRLVSSPLSFFDSMYILT